MTIGASPIPFIQKIIYKNTDTLITDGLPHLKQRTASKLFHCVGGFTESGRKTYLQKPVWHLFETGQLRLYVHVSQFDFKTTLV